MHMSPNLLSFHVQCDSAEICQGAVRSGKQMQTPAMVDVMYNVVPPRPPR